MTINDLFWRTEITLTSTYAGAPFDCQTALKLIKEGGIHVLETVTHRLGMSEAHLGFQAVCAPTEHDCIKVIVTPQRQRSWMLVEDPVFKRRYSILDA